MDKKWINVIVSGTLFGQGMSIHLSSGSLSGLYSSSSAVSFIVQISLGVLSSISGLTHGIRDFALFAYACATVVTKTFPVSLLLGMDSLIGDCILSSSGRRSEFATVSLLWGGFALMTLLGLSHKPAYSSTSLVSSLVLLLASHRKLLAIWESIDKPSQHHIATNTEPKDRRPNLRIVSHLHFTTESEIELLSPIVKGILEKSPLAESTRSLISPTPFITDSISSDTDVERENDWYYVDLTGSVQGPFPGNLMRHWYESGFLLDELQVSTQREDRRGFAAISHIKKAYGGQIPFF